jgi:hypothetical protein
MSNSIEPYRTIRCFVVWTTFIDREVVVVLELN